MAETTPIRRTGDLRVKLDPTMLSRLENIAKEYGMPPATYAAFALAEHVITRDQKAAAARSTLLSLQKNLGETFTPAEMEKLVSASLQAGMNVALSQKNLPLDGEASAGHEA